MTNKVRPKVEHMKHYLETNSSPGSIDRTIPCSSPYIVY